MSMHGAVGIFTDKKKDAWKARYIHFDGDPESTGRHLVREYKRLMELWNNKTIVLEMLINNYVLNVPYGWSSLRYSVNDPNLAKQHLAAGDGPENGWLVSAYGEVYWTYIIDPIQGALHIYKGRLNQIWQRPIKVAIVDFACDAIGLEPAVNWQTIYTMGEAGMSMVAQLKPPEPPPTQIPEMSNPDDDTFVNRGRISTYRWSHVVEPNLNDLERQALDTLLKINDLFLAESVDGYVQTLHRVIELVDACTDAGLPIDTFTNDK